MSDINSKFYMPVICQNVDVIYQMPYILDRVLKTNTLKVLIDTKIDQQKYQTKQLARHPMKYPARHPARKSTNIFVLINSTSTIHWNMLQFNSVLYYVYFIHCDSNPFSTLNACKNIYLGHCEGLKGAL